VGFVDVVGIGHVLPDGRVLFADVSFRVGEGAKVALVGPNGAGKTTLLRMIAGDLPVPAGTITRTGGLGVMRQFIGAVSDDRTLAELALSLAPPAVQAAGERLASAEAALSAGTERDQLAYAEALAGWGEAGGYEAEVVFDTVSVAVLGLAWDQARDRPVRTLSGGEQKRFALELLLRGPDEVLLLDEPDNFLDVPAKRWLEQRLTTSAQSVLYVSHDRELLAQTADRVVTVEGGVGVDPPGRVRELARGARGASRPARRGPPPLGRGARQATGADAALQAEGVVQLGHGLALPGRPDPAAQVRGGGPAAAAAEGAGHPDAAGRRAHGQAGGHLPAARA
jgi:ATPase subunit of ABC transporter with duplicated ATPase domains